MKRIKHKSPIREMCELGHNSTVVAAAALPAVTVRGNFQKAGFSR